MSARLLDLIIVGSGPAGSCAAIEAARSGLDVVVLERARLPRYKTCGGGLTQRALRILPIDPSPVVERELRVFDLSFLESRLSFRVTRPFPIIAMTMRDRFDQ